MATGTQTEASLTLLIAMIETQNGCQNVHNNILQVIVYSLCKLTDQHIH